jgi:hypothetical protein
MTRKTWSVTIVGLVVLAICLVPSFLAVAQEKGTTPPPPPAAKEVTLTGKVVDLHCFMAGGAGKEDATKCMKECIEKGVPAVLETSKGIVLLGKGMEGVAKLVGPHANQQVEVKGKLHEKAGLKYLDIIEIKKAEEKGAEKPVAKPEPKPEVKPVAPKGDKPAPKPGKKG